MLRRRDPVSNSLAEFFGRHAGVSRSHQLQSAFFARGANRFKISLEQRSEGFLILPFRVCRSERFDPFDHEEELEIDWLLSPERSVVVKDGNALWDWNKLRVALSSHPLDEGKNCFPGSSIIP